MQQETRLFLLKTVFIFISFFFTHSSFSQGRTGFLAGAGIMYYNGDVDAKANNIFALPKIIKPFFRLGVNYHLSGRAEASLSFLRGSIAGDDALSDEKSNLLRNQSFKSVMNELSLQLEYHLFSVYNPRRLNPFIYAGAGLFHFNPTAELNGGVFYLQPLGTEGQYILSGDYSKPYGLTQMSIPLGIGVYFQLNDRWRLRLDIGHHITFTDYLDDVSTVYPDSSLLAQTPFGPAAIAVSAKRLDGGYPAANRSRGNSKNRDSFSHIGISVIFNPGDMSSSKGFGQKGFGKKRRKGSKSCPAYD